MSACASSYIFLLCLQTGAQLSSNPQKSIKSARAKIENSSEKYM
jgi:hypothetical protein